MELTRLGAAVVAMNRSRHSSRSLDDDDDDADVIDIPSDDEEDAEAEEEIMLDDSGGLSPQENTNSSSVSTLTVVISKKPKSWVWEHFAKSSTKGEYSMLIRLIRLKNYLQLLEDEGEDRCNLTEAQWVIVKDLAALLSPFMVA
jgi:hypothetical protein